jgi:hypothetical protein
MNVQDTLPLLLRMLDSEEMAKYECMTPTTLDYLSRLPRRRGASCSIIIDVFGDATQEAPRALRLPGRGPMQNPANAGNYATGTNDFHGTQTSVIQLLPQQCPRLRQAPAQRAPPGITSPVGATS